MTSYEPTTRFLFLYQTIISVLISAKVPISSIVFGKKLSVIWCLLLYHRLSFLIPHTVYEAFLKMNVNSWISQDNFLCQIWMKISVNSNNDKCVQMIGRSERLFPCIIWKHYSSQIQQWFNRASRLHSGWRSST